MARRAAIAFDIDGVFKYGREWSEHGLDALKRASAAGISYVFVTNGGGGLTEGTYGSHLKEKVLEAGGGQSGDIALPSAERMVLSYTPWHTQLAPELADKRVMLVGDPKVMDDQNFRRYMIHHIPELLFFVGDIRINRQLAQPEMHMGHIFVIAGIGIVGLLEDLIYTERYDLSLLRLSSS